MRYCELVEDQRDYEGEAQTWSLMIQRDCGEYLSMVEDPFSLYKGSKEEYRFEKKAVRLEGRKAVEMNPMHKVAINKVWTEQFGAPFRDSLFVFGDAGDAEFFGTAHYVFPIGKFEFLWSPKVWDLNYKTRSMIIHTDLDDSDPGTGSSEMKDVRRLMKAVQNAGYQNTDLEDAIDSGNEIMIRCKEYYIMEANYATRTGQINIMREILE